MPKAAPPRGHGSTKTLVALLLSPRDAMGLSKIAAFVDAQTTFLPDPDPDTRAGLESIRRLVREYQLSAPRRLGITD
jgi:hypothetical protein